MLHRDEHGRFAQQKWRAMPLFTNGRWPCIDRLATAQQCFEEMSENERRAAMVWFTSKYARYLP